VSHEHATLPVATPSLDHLTDEELNALRGKLSNAAKEARRKANQVIQRSPSLKKPWTKSLSVSKATPSDERAAIFADFERELLRVPEAYIAHAFANSLVTLDAACREALQQRSQALPKRRGAPAPAPIPNAPEEGPLDAAFRQIE
jgi:hypothetical protein